MLKIKILRIKVQKFDRVHKKTEPFAHVDIRLLADDVSKTATNTFDGGKGKHDILLTVNIRVQNTQNVLKFLVGD